MLFAVIMITLTAMGQSKVSKIKVNGIVEVKANGEETYKETTGYIGLDLNNSLVYTYYENGTKDTFKYIVDRNYVEDNYRNVETSAININNGNRISIYMAEHLHENIIIITFADNKSAVSFIGKIIN